MKALVSYFNFCALNISDLLNNALTVCVCFLGARSGGEIQLQVKATRHYC